MTPPRAPSTLQGCELEPPSAREQETLERVANSSISWEVAGRDADGNLVLAAVVHAGHRRAVRCCFPTLAPAGHLHREVLVDVPA